MLGVAKNLQETLTYKDYLALPEGDTIKQQGSGRSLL